VDSGVTHRRRGEKGGKGMGTVQTRRGAWPWTTCKAKGEKKKRRCVYQQNTSRLNRRKGGGKKRKSGISPGPG